MANDLPAGDFPPVIPPAGGGLQLSPGHRLSELETRVGEIERQLAEFGAGCAAAVERIEALEPTVRSSGDTDISLRRTALARLGPFGLSPYDKDSITTFDGRRFLAVYSASERDLVLQALNDAYLAEK